MKNKKLFLVIYIVFLIIITISIIVLSILGQKERIGYLSEFKFDGNHINKTLELNGFNIEETKKKFISNNILDNEALINYIFSNESITNYSYSFRIEYYSKIFRHGDIYGVYPNINKILENNNYIKKIEMGKNGSPFGNLVSEKIIDFGKIDNVSYKLSLRYSIVALLIFIYIIYTFLLYVRKIVFENNKYKLLFFLITFIFYISLIYALQINILYIIDLLILAVESIFIYKYNKNISKFINNIVISNKLILFVSFMLLVLLLYLTSFTNINFKIKYIMLFTYLNIFFILLGILSINKFNLLLNFKNLFYISFFIFLFNINMSYNYLNSNSNLNKFVIFFIYSLVVSSFLFIFYIYSEYKKLKLEKIFLVSLLIIGVSYFIFLPPMEVPDEGAHYIRAYEISKGFMTYNKTVTNQIGNYLPVEVGISSARITSYSELIDKFNIKTSGKEHFFSTSALHYFPISYFPQSLGMFLGRLIHIPIYAEIYLGKLFILLFFVFLMYFSIKYIPFKKMTIYFLCFLPMVFQQTISLSADSVLIISSLAFISAVLYFKYSNKNIISIKECILLFLLSLLVAMSKSLYIFIFLLIFTIPKEKFKYNKYLTIFSILFFILIIYVLWSRNISGYISSANNFDLKKEYILNNPIGYLGIFLNTIKVKFNFYLATLIGKYLAWLDIPINDFVYYSILLLILIFIVFDSDRRIKLDLNIISFIIVCIVYTLILTGLYVTWTPIEYDFIEGVQGRYFLPIIFLVFILFNFDYFKHINFKVGLDNKIIFIILSMLNINVINTIFNNFFI